jgi:hypothetical protein
MMDHVSAMRHVSDPGGYSLLDKHALEFGSMHGEAAMQQLEHQSSVDNMQLLELQNSMARLQELQEQGLLRGAGGTAGRQMLNGHRFDRGGLSSSMNDMADHLPQYQHQFARAREACIESQGFSDNLSSISETTTAMHTTSHSQLGGPPAAQTGYEKELMMWLMSPQSMRNGNGNGGAMMPNM